MLRTIGGLTLATLLTGTAIAGGPAAASPGGTPERSSANAIEYAVIGDTPYGPAQVRRFHELVDSINRDPKVRTVVHVGDIKNGSTECSDAYFDFIARRFATFADPLVYTPGDNEWTDCHRANNGSYLPTERLAKLREVFFADQGQALGRRPMALHTQADDPPHATFVENVRWSASRVTFAAIHSVGSNDGLAPWFGAAETDEQREERLAEVTARQAAALAWIDEAFDVATRRGEAGVALFMQADTFRNVQVVRGFEEIVDRIADRAAAFDRPVLLVQGDSHRYLVDRPLPDTPKLTRLVVEGETVDEWLRLVIDPRDPQLFRWDRVYR